MLLELYISDAMYVTSLTAITLIVGGLGFIGSRSLLAKRKFALTYQIELAEIKKNELQARVDAQESMYRAVSYDIHDDIGQKLCLGEFYIERSEAKDLADSSLIVSDVVQQLRDLSHNLSAADVKNRGLTHAIRRDLENMKEKGGMNVHCNFSGDYK